MTHPGHVGAVLGAPAHDPTRAAVALRALASRHGLDLADATDTDTAAAVAGAELWAATVGLSPATESHLAPPGALACLSRIVARAAGRCAPPAPVMDTDDDVPERVLVAVDAVLDWLEARVDRDEVIARVASDLAGDRALEAASRALHPGTA